MEIKYEAKNAWKIHMDNNSVKEVMNYSKGYMDFLFKSKTERSCAKEIIKQAKENGYISLEEAISKGSIKAGDKIYANNKDKGVCLFLIGKNTIENGMRIIGSHIDSPRLDLKANPLYEEANLGLFKTHYYGGIKKYQWLSLPLALSGVVILKDGRKIDICIGEDETDPVFCITDILPHLASDQNQKKISEAIKGEDLNLLIGSIPTEEKDGIVYNVLNILNEKYNMVEEDFLSAELQVVPAGKPRDLGLDKSMVLAYGHDDKVCTYAAITSIFDIEESDYTLVTLCADKEEVGSNGNTGMQSRFFENIVAELIELEGSYSDLKIKRALSKSKVLSADVSAGYDPNFSSAYDKRNSAYMGSGVVLIKYTGARGKSGCNDANAEFLAEVRNVFNNENVVWQTGELGKVDQGGGGTIAYMLANYGAEVVDCGVGVLSMHAPYEVISKVDLYEMYKGYRAFFNQIKL
ncbi:aminopeptidase [Romboutsia ilealis]|uniref:M18 family aminopeptidase n=1 Tax=Romboutsia faecis TaxID=2764597 RepID=A0ABR7JLU1_9FIRM|nr:aminopeptidase [Romboutsia faecis]MBC5995737.1 aminopeptidase [Romboutsia faecis]MRN23938.1 aminopeptidase [Romboutsia ilealis]